ncbi:uncharacterized protein LOC135152607 isoform X2 [Daucus carota subsp. sativus]|uniref:uncharacterized protein LOC135152607 isoform X2 n=1 Tax=Daucus carota subsp. sativus TaxID=79200 RepID=UPI0030827036
MPCLFKVGTPRVCVFYSPPAPCCRQDLLFLQRRAENIKKSRTIGTSSAFDNISSGKNATSRVPLSTVDHNESNQYVGNSHSPLSNSRRYSLVAETCESDYALKATGRVLLSTVDQNASNQSIRRSPLSNIDQNANPGFCVGFYRHRCQA